MKDPYTLSRTHIPDIFCIQILQALSWQEPENKTSWVQVQKVKDCICSHRHLGTPGCNFVL